MRQKSTEPRTRASKITDSRYRIRASPWQTGLFLPRTLRRNVLLQRVLGSHDQRMLFTVAHGVINVLMLGLL